MTIKVVIEFQAKPGARTELKDLLERISATHGPSASGFLGSTVYEVLDNADGLVEIAEWESTQAQSAAVEQAMAAGVYAPVVDLVAAPFRATRIGRVRNRDPCSEPSVVWIHNEMGEELTLASDIHAVIEGLGSTPPVAD